MLLKTPCKISEPYDKPFWEKSMWHRKKKKKNNTKYSGHFVSQQRPRAAHTLRSDQNNTKYSGHFVSLQRLRAAYALRSDQLIETNNLRLTAPIQIKDVTVMKQVKKLFWTEVLTISIKFVYI